MGEPRRDLLLWFEPFQLRNICFPGFTGVSRTRGSAHPTKRLSSLPRWVTAVCVGGWGLSPSLRTLAYPSSRALSLSPEHPRSSRISRNPGFRV